MLYSIRKMCGIYKLTHLLLVPHICVSESGQHWLRWWVVAYSAPSHYLNQCWVIVNWTLSRKLQWNLNKNTKLFIGGNAFVKLWPFCPEGDEFIDLVPCRSKWGSLPRVNISPLEKINGFSALSKYLALRAGAPFLLIESSEIIWFRVTSI